MFLWGTLILSMPLAMLLETQFRVPMAGVSIHLPWMHAIVVYYALRHRLPVAFTAALMGGLLMDAYTWGQPGVGVIVYGGIVYLADRFRRQIVSEALVTAVVFGMVTSLTFGILRLGLLYYEGHRGLSAIRVLAQVGGGVLFAALLTPLVSILMQGIHRGLDIVPSEEDQHVNA